MTTRWEWLQKLERHKNDSDIKSESEIISQSDINSDSNIKSESEIISPSDINSDSNIKSESDIKSYSNIRLALALELALAYRRKKLEKVLSSK